MALTQLYFGPLTQDTVGLIVKTSADTFPGTVDSGPHNMTSDVLPSPFVASATSEFSGTRAAWNAFDGTNASTHDWLGTGSGVDKLEIDLGSSGGLAIVKYGIGGTDESSSGSLGRGPKAWTFQGSNDNSTWTTLDTQTSQTTWSTGVVNYYSFTNTTVYRYYRLNITANVGGGTFTTVGELYLFTSYTAARGGFGVIGRLLVHPVITESAVGGGFVPNSPSWGSIGSAMPGGVVSTAYEYDFEQVYASSPVTYSIVSGSLPTGLSLSALGTTGGKISGTPTVAGSYSFTLKASNTYGTANKAFTLVISNAGGGGSFAFSG